MPQPKHGLPIAVIGAGPVGLAAAAHLIERGFTPLILEAGESAGANLASYAHVQLFSPWRYNVDKAASKLLAELGWRRPDADKLPTAGEIVVEYLAPLAAHPAIAPHVRYRHAVASVSRSGVDKVKTAQREQAPFVLRAFTPEGEREFLAQAVLDASGTWNQPNPIGANGLPALGEPGLGEHIDYGMPDILGRERQRYAGKRVLVVGSGHSAAGNLIALAELAESSPSTQIIWAIRGENWMRIFGGGEADGLPARGQLGVRLKRLYESGRLQVHTSFRIQELHRDSGRITVLATSTEGAPTRISGVEQIIAATGARPNLNMTRELRVRHDHWLESTEALAPLIDPNEHSCGTVRPHGHRELAHPESGYYAIGAKSYGRAPTFLLATGYEQARSVVAALAGDYAAADDVQLELPETGVCNVSFGPKDDVSTGCCGGPPKQARVISLSPSSKNKEAAQEQACCAADEQAKASGLSGCGCNSKRIAAPARSACCG